jgi:RHH-type proline utilization regulon transcriptional repressor/proline dehydrogenase/delta 1-pyrroline-5-carboxylate dehydrogenase
MSATLPLPPAPMPLADPPDRLPPPCRDEGEVLAELLQRLSGHLDWPRAAAQAGPWVAAVRANPAPFWAMESLLREYPISSAEGLALMRLAEALLRVPDAETAVALTADQLGRAAFDAGSGGPHQMLANLSATAIALSKKFLPGADADSGLLRRLGAQTVVAATVRAIGLLGRQFVLGRQIGEAMAEADAARRSQSALRFSYDMLGEGARTDADALRYLASYRQAIAALAVAGRALKGPEARDGISIKLSALSARYDYTQREQVWGLLLPRVWGLVEAAAEADINLTIDAEESDRLELSLELFEALAARIASRYPAWQGFGLAVQAYQTRALAVVDEVARIARQHGLRCMVRLVKGAYWDGEIKRAQELGLAGYPVFTHKHHTDIAYLACARALIGHAVAGQVYPQFATHNAGTIAALLQMGEAAGARFELQRLHGMGEGVYRELMRASAVPVRVYAPVGEHRDLLAYLVRRLLENGANSSFVHQMADESLPLDSLLASPLVPADSPGLPPPVAMFGWTPGGPGRRNARGLDLACARERAPLLAALDGVRLAPPPEADPADVDPAMRRLHAAQPAWNARPLARRAAILRDAADRLEAELPAFCARLVKEAHKTWGDAVAELREAVDFLRYYADEAEARLAPQTLPGPTGERNTLSLHGRGVFVCISPWNFPLAIFVGQVAAALVTGNAVAAKPAEQTPQVAAEAVALLHAAGVPEDVLQLLHGPGETIGAALVAHPLTAGVCFTGSTAVSRLINRALAAKDGPIVPLIAETGGLNAMLVDSSALPEQVVDAVVQSAFRSAGQRCSALRLLCVHEGIADAVIEMIRGAMQVLVLGDPARLATDVGPLIDAEAHALISAQVARLRGSARLVGETPWPEGAGPLPDNLLAPVAFELDAVSALREEVFGPVLHIVRWRGDIDRVLDEVHALGYGLTLGIQTRIDARAQRLAEAARIGNVYVNRNMVGAVVGVQPFGGEGLSGTGPKAGGPHYLWRFCGEKTVSINTAAAGGNVELLAHPARTAAA